MKLTKLDDAKGDGKKKEKTPKIVLGAPPVADLMPPRSRDVRERRVLKRQWLMGFAAAAIATFAITGGAMAMNMAAKSSYNKEVESQKSLNAQIAEYKEVSDALNKQSDLTAKRKQALKSEVKWGEMMARINGALPRGVYVSGFTSLIGNNPSSKTAGGLTVVARISSDTPQKYADVIKYFASVDGLKDIVVGDLTSTTESTANGKDKRVYTSTVALVFDTEAFSYRMDPELGERMAKKEKKDETEASDGAN